MKKLFRMLFQRVVIVAFFILVQAFLLVAMIWKFNDYFVYFYAICTVLSIVVVLYIINSRSNPGYKIAWIVPILLVPIFGGLFYLMFGGNRLGKRERRKMAVVAERARAVSQDDCPVLDRLCELNPEAGNQSRYINDWAGYPPYQHTQTEFLPMGEVKFQRLTEELNKAEHYIFLEYFIIQEGTMWNTILDILVKKVKQGVDVRVIYDDMGCITTLPYKYDKKLESLGIRCKVFSPFIPVLSSRLNNRDHRKIAVIDGHTAFTGGINLADEYINAYPKHGHWKDCGIMLKGDAVWSFTVAFLSMWDYLCGLPENDYSRYRPAVHQAARPENDGFVQPFSDSPLDGEAVGETVYLNLINKAKRYLYISTPYLIIDNEMVTALSIAAKAGVDVRITTPHVADKWFVHAVTRAYYEQLLEAGVKIYEYTPGFIHAKTFVVDDEYAVVGSINLDYRSLYLHFECAAWLYGAQSVLAVRDDYQKTLEFCHEITLEECRQVKWYRRIGRAFLRAFAPLM